MGVREIDTVSNSGVNVEGVVSSLVMLVLLVVICVFFYKLIKKLLDR